MATFAELNSNNVVLRVISVHNNELLENNVESEAKGVSFCKSLYGQNTIWKQCSYNTGAGVHYTNRQPSEDQSKAFRKNKPSEGWVYDEARDAFINPKLCENMVFNEDQCLWLIPDMPSLDSLNPGKIWIFDYDLNGGEWKQEDIIDV